MRGTAMNRRTFLQTSLAAAALSSARSLSQLLAQEGAATSSIGLTLAGSIGKSLASGVLGSIGAAAFGQIMSAMGVDMSGLGAVNRKLDEILGQLNKVLAQLDALNVEVGKLQSSMDHQFADLDYKTQFGYVRPLIDRNLEIARQFTLLLQASQDDARGLRDRISEKLFDGDYLSGLQTWKGALLGYDAQSSSGLIRGFSHAVYLRTKPMFGVELMNPMYGPDDAIAIQQQWDYFDAQQAMTVNFLVEQINLIPNLSAEGRIHQQRALIEEWTNIRQAQLALLRGCASPADDFPIIDGDQITYRRTMLPALPPNCAIDKKSNKMWYLTLTEAFTLPPTASQFFAIFDRYTRSFAWRCGDQMCQMPDWRMPTEADLVELVTHLGGGAKWNEQHLFAPYLSYAGFRKASRLPQPEFISTASNIWLDANPAAAPNEHVLNSGIGTGLFPEPVNGKETVSSIGQANYAIYPKCLVNWPGPGTNDKFYGKECQYLRRAQPYELFFRDGGEHLEGTFESDVWGSFIAFRSLVKGETYWS
jgi:hypothetical protein